MTGSSPERPAAAAPGAVSPGGYELLDSGHFEKMERFGALTLVRPCAQAIWRPRLDRAVWAGASARFSRDGGNRWQSRERLPERWVIEVDGIRFQLGSTDFGHLGLFPEQRPQWRRIRELCAAAPVRLGRPARVINLFAYSGGSTLAAAAAGAEVCHVDASRGMVDWARENAMLNACGEKPVRWIVDDVTKFLEREDRRGRRYDAVILDPPSFGRGAKGEVFKIEEHLPPLLDLIRRLLTEAPLFLLLSCHTPEITPLGLAHLLRQTTAGLPGRVESGELCLEGGPDVLPVPSGNFALWLGTETGSGRVL